MGGLLEESDATYRGLTQLRGAYASGVQWKREGQCAVATFRSFPDSWHFVYGNLDARGIFKDRQTPERWSDGVVRKRTMSDVIVFPMGMPNDAPVELRIPLYTIDSIALGAALLVEQSRPVNAPTVARRPAPSTCAPS